MVILISSKAYRYSYDDAYITYRYAYNLASGHGFAYNAGETHLGTTAPLFAMLLAVLSIPNPEWVPTIGGIVSSISLLAICLGLYFFAKWHGQSLAGWATGVVFAFFPPVLETFGGEMLTVVALVVWAIIVYDRGRTGWAGIIVALATLFRGDGGLAIVVLGLHFLISNRSIPWRMGIGFVIPIALWMAYSIQAFGSFLPDTLSVKMAQGRSGYWPSFWKGLTDLFWRYIGDLDRFITVMVVYRVLVVLFVVGFIWLAYKSIYSPWAMLNSWGLLLAWPVLHGLTYILLLKVPYYHWYYVPILLGIMIFVGLGVQALADLIKTITSAWQGRAWLGTAVALGFIIPMIAAGFYKATHNRLFTQAPYTYPEVGRWLAEHLSANSSLGYLEVGYIGYYSRLQIIDPMGLVTPGVLPSIEAGDLAFAYRQYLPDYILVNPQLEGFFGPYRQEPWWKCYSLVSDVLDLDLYQRCPKIDHQDRITLQAVVHQRDTLSEAITSDPHERQTFSATANGLRGVGVIPGTYGEVLGGTVTFHLRRVGTNAREDLRVVTLDAEQLKDNQWQLFFFEPIGDSLGIKFEIWLEIVGNETPLVLWKQSGNPYLAGENLLDGQPQDDDLSLRLYYTQPQ